jgi:hypothetical protein
MVEMCNNSVITCLTQNTHETQAIRSPGDPYNNRRIAAQSALISKNGLNIFEHRTDITKSDTTPPAPLTYFQDG